MKTKTVERVFVERTPLSIIIFTIQTNARRLKRIGYDKTMPYYEKELLEFVIQVMNEMLDGDPQELKLHREIIDEVVAKRADYVARGVSSTPLPDCYADILDDVMEMVLFVTSPDRFILATNSQLFIDELNTLKNQLESRV